MAGRREEGEGKEEEEEEESWLVRRCMLLGNAEGSEKAVSSSSGRGELNAGGGEEAQQA